MEVPRPLDLTPECLTVMTKLMLAQVGGSTQACTPCLGVQASYPTTAPTGMGWVGSCGESEGKMKEGAGCAVKADKRKRSHCTEPKRG